MIPSPYILIAYWCWPVIAIVWLMGYLRTKKTVRRPELGKYLFTTLLIGAGFLLLFSVDYLGFAGPQLTLQNFFLGSLGDILCIAGGLFAIWARITLGSNWSGSVATLKEEHELAQRGPYRIVRHPIYTGLFFAMLGTALTTGLLVNYLGVLVALSAFLIRIPIEEKLMLEQFSDAYIAYKKRVKALIPFVW